jgi:alpha-L-rhamnosidase
MKKKLIILVSCLLLTLSYVYSQIPDPLLPPFFFNKPWSGKWVAAAGEPQHDYGIYHYRKNFFLSSKPLTFLVHVSGDNRYKLFVNEKLVCIGPAASDVRHWKFETIDLAPYLKAGNNLVASVVWNFGEKETATRQQSFRSGFIVQANNEGDKIINTDKSWKAIRNPAYSPAETKIWNVIGPGEKIEADKYIWGWEKENYNDSGWKQTEEISPGLMGGIFVNWDYDEGWQLTPGIIPGMEMSSKRLVAIRTTKGIQIPENYPQQPVAITIPSNSRISILFDQGTETTAYPVLKISKGKAATIRLQYAESLYEQEGADGTKGNRNMVENKTFKGYEDVITSDGGNNRQYNTLWWRAFRYINLVIETKGQPLILEDLYSVYTGYPFKLEADFEAEGRPELSKILEIGWRTARLCAHDNYMDCPYYEQLQYVGDTRIQALVSLYNSGDDRLMKNAIIQIRNSHGLDGITQSQYPSRAPQYIPTFSLWWISIVADYYQYRGDKAFIQNQLPVGRAILHFFETKQHTDGSLGKLPYWNFTDWAKNWEYGIAPVTDNGNSAPLDLQLLLALQAAMYLEKQVGMNDFVNLYDNQIKKLTQTIKALYWDKTKGLFADTPDKVNFSEQTNSLAILTGVISGNEAKAVIEKMLSDKSITRATIFFKYYLNQALVKAGLGNRYLQVLDEWHAQISLGLTTWAETPEPSRSDCHAWGSSPNIEFYRIVLGIDSDAPGFSKVKIEPHLGELKKVKGEMPHPGGKITASYRLENGKWNIRIGLPEKITGYLMWKGKKLNLKSGINIFTVT